MIKKHLKTFRDDCSGSLSIESVIMLPVLLWVFSATLVFWDAFKTYGNAVSATYMVGDIVSRETSQIDNAYVNGLRSVFEQVVTTAEASDVRISMIRYRPGLDPLTDPPFHELVSSEGTGTLPDRTGIADIAGNIPLMALGSSLIYVETMAGWTPFSSDILEPQTFENGVYINPRFVSELNFAAATP